MVIFALPEFSKIVVLYTKRLVCGQFSFCVLSDPGILKLLFETSDGPIILRQVLA